MRNYPSGALKLAVLVGAMFAVLMFFVDGCTTAPASKLTASAAAKRPPLAPDLSLLSVGMSIRDVRRLEPPPDRVLTMTSDTMQVEQWVYTAGGAPIKLNFANGVLQSWTR